MVHGSPPRRHPSETYRAETWAEMHLPLQITHLPEYAFPPCVSSLTSKCLAHSLSDGAQMENVTSPFSFASNYSAEWRGCRPESKEASPLPAGSQGCPSVGTRRQTQTSERSQQMLTEQEESTRNPRRLAGTAKATWGDGPLPTSNLGERAGSWGRVIRLEPVGGGALAWGWRGSANTGGAGPTLICWASLPEGGSGKGHTRVEAPADCFYWSL